MVPFLKTPSKMKKFLKFRHRQLLNRLAIKCTMVPFLKTPSIFGSCCLQILKVSVSIGLYLKSSSIASNNRQNDNKDFLHYASSCLMLGIYEGMGELFELTSLLIFEVLYGKIFFVSHLVTRIMPMLNIPI